MIKKSWLQVIVMLAVLGGCEHLKPRHHHNFPLAEISWDLPELQESGPTIENETQAPKVSLDLEAGLPIIELFHELSRQTEANLTWQKWEGNPKLYQTYTVRDKPLLDVIEDICELSGLRYREKGGVIHIEVDDPYLKVYNLPFLNNQRTSETQMSITTDVFSNMDKGKRHVDNGSSSKLKSSVGVNAWPQIHKDLEMMLRRDGEFSIQAQAGVVTVRAAQKYHKLVSEYFRILKQSMGVQVLIEARIVEVQLQDEFRAGINWSVLGEKLSVSSAMGLLSSPGALNSATGLKRDVFTTAFHHNDFSSVLNFVKQHGEVRTLSNPRMTVMNNQPAMLKVATNEVFFQLEFDRYFQADGKPDVENFSSNIMTIPIGLVLVVQPCVDQDRDEITLTLRPTVSRIDKFVEDPAVAIKSNQRVALAYSCGASEGD